MSHEGKVQPVIGLQWGDEGKGKIIDHLVPEYDIVARPAGGPNTGHTVEVDGVTYKFHGLPEGALRPGKLNVIGPGALVDPVKLNSEINNFQDIDLIISQNAHLILPYHISQDEIAEKGNGRQGTTMAGIRYAAADKYERSGIPLGQIYDKTDAAFDNIVERLSEDGPIREELDLKKLDSEEVASEWINNALELLRYSRDTTLLLNKELDEGHSILASGAQSHWLDMDDQPYPYGSSTHTGVGGVVTGLQVPATSVLPPYGVMKVFKSRVGDGPFVTEVEDQELATRLRGPEGRADSEFGTTSKRPRRVGYLDLPEVRRSIMANGVAEVALTKLDHAIRFGGSMLIAMAYDSNVLIAPNQTAELQRFQVQKPIYEEVGLWAEKDNWKVKSAQTIKELPRAAQQLVRFLQNQLDVKVTFIGTGADRYSIIDRRSSSRLSRSVRR